MNKFHNEQNLLRQLAALPREMTPRNDPWPLISARIGVSNNTARPDSQRFQIWPLAIAASLIVMIAAGVLLNRPWAESDSSPDNLASGKAIIAHQNVSYIAEATLAGELEYQAAFKEFLAMNVSSASGPDTNPDWIEQGWHTLREAEIELLTALKNEPDNNFLSLRLAALRERQIDLLRQIATVDKTSRRNNT